MTKAEYLLTELQTRLWVKPSIMGIAAVFWVCFAYFGEQIWPEDLVLEVEREILINLLGIMASTMLTVATFTVAAMVSAYAAVSNTATPRATRIVMQDRSSQNSLTSFLAAFIYAIVALVAISVAPWYGVRGRFLIFVGFAASVVWVLIAFVRWVDRVSKLGRIGDTLERVEEAALEAFKSPEAMGTLGAHEAGNGSFSGASLKADVIGYVQNIDMENLNAIGKELECRIRVLERPGSFLDPHDSLVILEDLTEIPENIVKRVRQAFHLGDTRRVAADPRFGMILLAEIADRALSPAVNDPGTAIAVLGIQVRLLESWSNNSLNRGKVKYEMLEVYPIDPEELLDDALTAISRDGAGIVEVGARIQKTLHVITRLGHDPLSKAARHQSVLAMEQAEQALGIEAHKQKLRALAKKVAGMNEGGEDSSQEEKKMA